MGDKTVLRQHAPLIKLDELAQFLRITNTTVSGVVSLREQNLKDGASSICGRRVADTLDSEARSSNAMSQPVRHSALGIWPRAFPGSRR